MHDINRNSVAGIVGFFMIILISGRLAAQDYDISLIPDSLKENASAIVRNDSRYIDLNAQGTQATITSKYAVTVLDKSGDFMNSFSANYNKSSSLYGIKATMYNAQGVKIARASKNDFLDYGIGGLYHMYDDTRAVVYEPVPVSYPYTIEYEYTMKLNEFITLPSWSPVQNTEVSVEKAVFTLSVPADQKFSCKEMNLTETCHKQTVKGNDVYTWTLQNFKALENEPFSPHAANDLPKVIIAPESFTMDNYTGSFKSWNDFGKWIVELNHDRDVLPVECRDKVHQLTDSLKDPYEKIRVLYQFMQKNSRYVSINLGIGGYQPFDAITVYKNGYGDCKALSNYMKSLLSEAGIPSFYTLVSAGEGKADILTDFPSQQFNHVIVCVPVNQDTIWLECTSQTTPPGYIAGFTEDRHVLLISDDGGKIVKTRGYPAEVNRQERKAEVVLNPGLDLSAGIHTVYSGAQFDYPLQMLNESSEDQKKKLLRDIEIPEFKLNSFSIGSTMSGREPEGQIDLDLTLNHYVKTSGERIFLPLNLMNKNTNIPKTIKNRKRDVFFSSAYTDTDSIEYTIPDNYEIEYLPEKVNFSYDFGSYSSEEVVNGNKLVYVRKICRKKGLYPKEMYPDVVEFYHQVVKADNCKALLKKKNP